MQPQNHINIFEVVMKKISENLFVNVFANVIICLVIVTVFSFSIAGDIFTSASADSEKPFYKGNEERPTVSLMFNVYQGTEYIDRILQTLAEHNAKATFFIGGIWASKNNDVVKKIAESGNELGNHGYLHLEQNKISLEKNKQEIMLCHDLVKQITGKEMTLFAPPSGAFSSNTLVAAHDLGYKTIMWSKDTIDWRDHDSNLIFKRATKNIANGDLVLMHPTKETLKALGDVLEEIKKQGFNAVCVSENLK